MSKNPLIKQAIDWRKTSPDNWPTDRALRVRVVKEGVVEWGYFSDRNQWWVLVRLRFSEGNMRVVRDKRADIARMPLGAPLKEKESSASRRGANSIRIREQKLADCARLGISMRGLKMLRREGLV